MDTRGSLREAYSMHQMPNEAAQHKRDSALGALSGGNKDLDLANINAANPHHMSTQ